MRRRALSFPQIDGGEFPSPDSDSRDVLIGFVNYAFTMRRNCASGRAALTATRLEIIARHLLDEFDGRDSVDRGHPAPEGIDTTKLDRLVPLAEPAAPRRND